MHSLDKLFLYFTSQTDLLIFNYALYFHLTQQNEFDSDL
jgi:hypothetical protein